MAEARAPLVVALAPGQQGLGSARIGGKGATLVRLLAAGLPVPPGIAVTIDAFTAHLRAHGLEPLLRRAEAELGGDGPVPLDELRSGMLASVVDPGLLAEIAGWWRSALGGAGQVPILVRSSATVEDSAAHSFAGIFESVVAAEEATLARAILAVWGSVLSARAVAYYRIAGLARFPAMALVVQPLLEAERSGVMFTRCQGPGGEPRILVEHVAGGCDRLVRGSVDPERLWLPCGGPAVVTDTAGSPLRPGLARRLAALARTLEHELGAPQDVEWCARGDELTVLQARPITAGVTSAEDGAVAGPGLSGEPLLRGLGASAGQGTGSAHRVFHIGDADALAPGQVLVTPMTNPDMVAAMRNAAAVVTDVGGMICHAAIVSRELGIPCVVGTGRATALVRDGDPLTVDGTAGVVHAGIASAERGAALPALTWVDLWDDFARHARGGQLPLVSSVVALEHLPWPLPALVIAPWLDLSLDEHVQAVYLGGLDPAARRAHLLAWVERCARAAEQRCVERVFVLPLHLDRIWTDALAAALPAAPRLRLLLPEDDGARGVLSASAADGTGVQCELRPGAAAAAPGTVALPLGAARLHATTAPAALDGGAERLPSSAVFGTPPALRRAPMPSAARRRAFLDLIPVLRAAHARTAAAPAAEHEWLDPRPEVVITPMLKSVVLAGMETVPRALGFEDLEPMHVQWIRCRFHFRRDTFEAVLQRLLAATWDERFLAELLQRTRQSYDRLEVAAARFPASSAEWRAAPAEALRAALLPWWHAFTDFFALSFFLQAQGDDGLCPFLSRTVARGLQAAAAGLARERALPGVAELTAPTTPVLTAELLAALARVREALRRAGCASPAEGMAAYGRDPALRALLDAHLVRWRWMRERDPYFEPCDRPESVIVKALASLPAPGADYEAHAASARLAASLHFDLALGAGDARQLAYAVGYGHHLARERENHHIVWLRASYPFRLLCLEWERRLGERTPLAPRDVFFLELPEVLEAVERLPEAMPEELLARVRNRRRAWHGEARVEGEAGAGEPVREEDYW